MKNSSILLAKPFKTFFAAFVFFWICGLPAQLCAQGCGCTNCPQFMPDNFVGDFLISVDGAQNPTLGQNGQGVCGVTMHLDHEYIGDLTITLTSPSGQTVTLIGPEGFFGSTDGTSWDISFVPCNDPASPDAGFSDTWNNNQNWGENNMYFGSYYPNQGCLEDFNSGPVDGTWTLTVVDGQAIDVGNFYDYEIIFCDPSGIICFTCAADAGDLTQPNITECQGDPDLNLTLPPTYVAPFAPPPAAEYSYTYIVGGAGGVILAYEDGPDLTGYDPGSYTLCGLSYLTAQAGEIPAPNGSLTINQLSAQLDGGGPPFCGNISGNCVGVTINPNPPDEEEFVEICAPNCYLFHGTNYCQPGTYVQTITNAQGCSYQATLNLTVHQPAVTNLVEVVCEGECATTPGFEGNCSAGTYQELYQTEFGCDSLVILTLQVLNVTASATPSGNLDCNNQTIQIAGAGSSTGGTVTYHWTASNGGHIVGSNAGINVFVDQAGDYQLRVCRSGGGAFCCDSVEVSILDNSMLPSAPAGISGPSTICPGDSATYSAAHVAGADAYNWTVTNGTVSGGQGTDTVQVTWDINAASGTICASASNNCGASPDFCLQVSLSVPAAGQIAHQCDSTNTHYTVSFPVSGGTAPYSIPGGTVMGGIFSSNPIPSGLAYSFQVSDTNSCVSSPITGSFNCSCATSAGNMSLTPLAACENDTLSAIHLGGQSLDGNDVTAFVLHSGPGTTVVLPSFGQNVNGAFSFQPGMVYGQTYYISLVAGNNLMGLPDPADPCLSVAQGQPVVFHQNPVANAGLDHDTCGLTLLLNASSGIGIGTWSVIAAPAPDTLAITSLQNPNTAATASGYGVFRLAWALDNNGCTDTDTLALAFNPSPSITGVAHTCDGANENYTVSFQITGGTPQYSTSGSPAGNTTDSSFASVPVPNGGFYSFVVTDSAGCLSATLDGSFSCSCSTDAGLMNLSPLSACEGDSVEAQHLGNYNLDANDTVSYVLHTLPGSTLGQILAQNTSGVFGYLPGMAYGTTYYVSFVVGNNLLGAPDLQDPCLSVTPGQPVVFYQNPVANAGQDLADCGTTLNLNANAPAGGTGQWTIANVPSGGSLNISDLQSATAIATASGFGVYTLLWTLSENGCISTDTVNLQFNDSPALVSIDRDCDLANENYTVTLILSGGTVPYSVNGQPMAGNTYVSIPLPNGASYNYNVTDLNGCTLPAVAGAYSCNCGTDAGTMLAQPLSVCEGQSVTSTTSGDANLDANDVIAYVLHSGAGPSLDQVFGQNTTGVFAFDPAQMQFGTTYYISLVAGNPLGGFPDPLDPCFSVAPGQAVQWLQNPVPDAGPDLATCGQTIDLQAFDGPFDGTWSLVSGPGTVSFSNVNDPTCSADVSANGSFVFRWTELNGACPGMDELSVTFNALPTMVALDELCDPTNNEFVVTFTANNGLPPYSVNGLAGTFSGNTFTSLPIPNNTTYSFILADANGCESPSIAGAHNCACSTDAGTVQSSPATFCADLSATATWNNDATLDANDQLQFILHDGAGASVGNTIFATSSQPVFAFGGNLQFGVTYYISAIAGNNLAGTVDLNDPCLSVTPGAPVQWKPIPSAEIEGDATLCSGGSTMLSFSGTGIFPLTLEYSDGATLNTIVLTGPQTVTLDVTPAASTTFSLTHVTDGSAPFCDASLSDAVTVVVNQPAEAGTASAPLEFCANTGQLVNLSNLLTGADPGGQWSETSTLSSQSGAFSPAAGTFQPNGQTPGTYSFRYLLLGAAPCKDDETTVSVVIHPEPNADAGTDKTLNCNVLSANLGGAGSPADTYQWVFNGDTVGTERQLLADEGGTYTLLVTTPEGCTDTDVVVVHEDNNLPTAALSTARDVRCNGEKNGAVSVDSVTSTHPPVLYSLNGGPFGPSSLFEGLAPGNYVITLQDAIGCESETDTLTVGNPPLLTAYLGTDLELQLADSAHLLLQTSLPTHALQSIQWQPLLDSAAAGKPYQHFFPLQSLQVSVTVKDSSGCIAQDRILVKVGKPRNIFIPNVFKPDSGIEPLLYVFGGRDVEEIESFQIFDRWGEEVLLLRNFSPNDPSSGWDGRYKGEPVNPGVFVYYAVVRFIDGERVVFKGDVTVLR